MERRGQKTSTKAENILLMSARFVEEYPRLSACFKNIASRSRQRSIVKVVKSAGFRPDCSFNGMPFVFVSGRLVDNELFKLSAWLKHNSSAAQSSHSAKPVVLFLNFRMALKLVKSSGASSHHKCLFGGSTGEEIYDTMEGSAKIHSKMKRSQLQAYVRQYNDDLLVGDVSSRATCLWLQNAFFLALNISENDTKLVLDSATTLKQLCCLAKTDLKYLFERTPVHTNDLESVCKLLLQKEFFHYEINSRGGAMT